MFGTQNLGVFLLSTVALVLTPGQDTLYVLSRSAMQGRRAGLIAVGGIISGCMIQTLAAAFGLSAILAASSGAFLTIKWLGAAYLVFLGVQMVCSRANGGTVVAPMADTARWSIFRTGVFCNLSNPKTILFYLSFLPQFVAPETLNKIPALLFLGGMLVLTGMLWCLTIVGFSTVVARRLQSSPAAGVWMQRGAGALFVVLGIGIAAES